ncbi:uncharacterized protein ARB_04088 [Trichophyton benhamiae CBS 112371]|uniref:Uncharacterized protein n=1 Tax=Arthroderma benhamiae (strain ATCC MYA-4681 / CBS 112371) TaxID=663331 RepID=D4AIJ3_ARTBC|nr:uncharacterized protein ARB_04088 [Trichophyton benhamiae CBS 112371]EFE36566.1 hypothetical protein ARB_04088 [Trichophyton benhamiae CBS 112371]
MAAAAAAAASGGAGGGCGGRGRGSEVEAGRRDVAGGCRPGRGLRPQNPAHPLVRDARRNIEPALMHRKRPGLRRAAVESWRRVRRTPETIAQWTQTRQNSSFFASSTVQPWRRDAAAALLLRRGQPSAGFKRKRNSWSKKKRSQRGNGRETGDDASERETNEAEEKATSGMRPEIDLLV